MLVSCIQWKWKALCLWDSFLCKWTNKHVHSKAKAIKSKMEFSLPIFCKCFNSLCNYVWNYGELDLCVFLSVWLTKFFLCLTLITLSNYFQVGDLHVLGIMHHCHPVLHEDISICPLAWLSGAAEQIGNIWHYQNPNYCPRNLSLEEITVFSSLHFEGKSLDMRRYNFCQTEEGTEITLHASVSVIL